MSNEEMGFLLAMAEQPNNHYLVLIYADWLEEQGRYANAKYYRDWVDEQQAGEARFRRREEVDETTHNKIFQRLHPRRKHGWD